MTDDRHQVLVDAIREGCSITDAAKRLGVARKTVYRWIEADPQLGDDVRLARIQAGDLAITDAAEEAADVLRAIANDGDAANKDRVAAAKVLLDKALPRSSGSGTTIVAKGPDTLPPLITAEAIATASTEQLYMLLGEFNQSLAALGPHDDVIDIDADLVTTLRNRRRTP